MASPVRLPRTHVHPVHSRHAEADYELWVAVPERNVRLPSPDRFPVLVVPDANLWFGMVTDLTRIMHMLFGELPPLLVVGVAYPGDDFARHGEIRNRDLTPTPDPGFEAMARSMDPSWKPILPPDRRMGRAEAFLSFLVEEALPLVEEHHPAASGERTLFGSSLGGLFTVWACLTRPAAFSHFIASSPALWWDDEAIFDLDPRPSDTPPSLYLGVGGLEEGVPGLPWLDRFRTVSNVRRLAADLERAPATAPRIAAHVFEDETHTSVVPSTLTRGLRRAHARRP